MTAIPNTVALASIVADSEITSGDHRNNYSAIQTAINGLIAALSGGSAGQTLEALSSSSVGYVNVGGLYRKTTAKTVSNTVTETDLLNGEVTIGAGVLGTSGMLRLTLFLDGLNNSGGAVNWRTKIKLGGTTVYDSNLYSVANQGAPRFGWRLDFEMLNLGAANSNVCRVQHVMPSLAMSSSTAPVMTDVGTGEKWVVAEASFPTTIDTASSKLVEVTVTHGTALATIETKLYGAVVEVI